MISELTDFSRSMMLSITIQPIPTDEAVKIVQKRLLAIETDITNGSKNKHEPQLSANIPYEMEQMRKEIKEFLDDLTTRDQRMMFCYGNAVAHADTLEQLNNDTETLLSIGRKHLCTFGVLNYQQEDGMRTVLPSGCLILRQQGRSPQKVRRYYHRTRPQDNIDKGGLYSGSTQFLIIY